jgi:hypothetical protein
LSIVNSRTHFFPRLFLFKVIEPGKENKEKGIGLGREGRKEEPGERKSHRQEGFSRKEERKKWGEQRRNEDTWCESI